MKFRLAVLLVIVSLAIPGITFAQTFEKAGDIGQIAIPATALVVSAVKGDKKGAVDLIGSVLIAQAITQALKATVDATRPNGKRGSFPSGHTATVFAGASFLQKRYGWRYGAPAYAFAAVVGASRVQSRNHYTRDVLVGAAIGTAVGQLLTRPIGKRVNISPSFENGIGVVASIDFNK